MGATNFVDLLQYPEHDAILGGLVGMLVGDALGVGFEFHDASDIPDWFDIEMTPPEVFNRSHASVPPGTWSDDGAQALCLLASLQKHGKLDLYDFSNRLRNWRNLGYMAVDFEVFDIGIQTSSALDRLEKGVSPFQSGGALDSHNGNGSLMRVLPLALWHQGSDQSLVADAHTQSLPTHAHARSMVCCAYYCLVARGYLQKIEEPWNWAGVRLHEIYRDWPDLSERDRFLMETDKLWRFTENHPIGGTGYVLDTIWSASHAMQKSTFEDVVRTAIQYGNDTDTTACVAGGLAGIKFGLSGIPVRWLEQLRGYEIVEPLVRKIF
jgi:ADP-ribosyl-[dinitrogen reductase] hydrolase